MLDLHALIVDDNGSNSDVLNELLKLEGITCTIVNNPAQFSQGLSKLGQLDVVFLDLEMPHIDGYELLAMFKADPRFHNTPIVAYTVHISEIHEARLRGFDSFISKPLDGDVFSEQLSRILNGDQVWHQR